MEGLPVGLRKLTPQVYERMMDQKDPGNRPSRKETEVLRRRERAFDRPTPQELQETIKERVGIRQLELQRRECFLCLRVSFVRACFWCREKEEREGREKGLVVRKTTCIEDMTWEAGLGVSMCIGSQGDRAVAMTTGETQALSEDPSGG